MNSANVLSVSRSSDVEILSAFNKKFFIIVIGTVLFTEDVFVEEVGRNFVNIYQN